MKTLVVDDLRPSSRVIQPIVGKYGQCDTVNELRAIAEAFNKAWTDNTPYNLVCVDVKPPKVDGEQVLRLVRAMEEKMRLTAEQRARVILVTADYEQKTAERLRNLGCDAVFVKPINRKQLQEWLTKLNLVE